MSLKKSYAKLGAAMTIGMMAASGSAQAGNTFSNVAQNITTSTEQIPGLLSAMAYLFGILLGVLGVMKIKDHVENPGNTPLKDGAIRLAAGGALFALPIIYEAMFETVGTGAQADIAKLNKVTFSTK